MKLVLLTSGLVAIVAGTASASLFIDATQRHPAPAISAAALAPAAAVPHPAPPARFEIRQAPVPSLRVNSRPGLAHRAARDGAGIEQAGAPPSAPATAAARTMGEDAARAAILADGYRSVRSIFKDDDGHWTARVMRGETEIAVTVDTEGRVSSN